MLILLPPSEGKAAARSGRPLDPDRLSHPALNPVRERVIEALASLCAAGPGSACAALGLGPTQHDEVRHNARLRVAPTLPASRLYTGVLYEALDLASLPAPARRLATRWILVFSGLWGVLRLTDRVPPYRCPVGASLPGLGGLAAHWRPALGPVLAAAGTGPILDLRSGAYGAMWAPSGELAARTVTVRVLHERTVDGVSRRTPVSHFNKATKGRLVRDLAVAGARPRRVADVASALRDLKYAVDEHEPVAGRPRHLDVVVAQL